MRTGWTLHGVKDPESVADHMYRMALLSILLPCFCILLATDSIRNTKVNTGFFYCRVILELGDSKLFNLIDATHQRVFLLLN